MNAQDVYQLVKSLSADEKRIMNSILIQLAKRTSSKLIDLFDELYKLREWKVDTDHQLRRNLGMGAQEFYKNRLSLGLRMLRSFPRLNKGDWNLAQMFKIALQKGHLRDLAEYLMDSIHQQVEAENWALAIELQEIAEDFVRRHGSDKFLDGLEELDDTLVYADALRQERHFRSGLKRVRSAVKLEMNQRRFIGKSMVEEFEGVRPLSKEANYLKETLMVGIPLLAGERHIAADLGSSLVKRLFESESPDSEKIFDELAYLIPLLLALKRESEAKYFTFYLPKVEVLTKDQFARRQYLEVVNLI